MPSRPLSVLIVASEAAPFAKTGGLADVSSALVRDLVRRGHDARLLLPFYRRVRTAEHGLVAHPDLKALRFTVGGRGFTGGIRQTADGATWFLDVPELFDREGIYCGDGDEHVRFAALSRGALELCRALAWSPDVIHCNDWHTGLLPLYLKAQYARDPYLAGTRTLLTIHNLGYQGDFPAQVLSQLGLEPHVGLLHQGDLRQGKVGFLRTGLIYADLLSTVSVTYAREIQGAELGMGLDGHLRSRGESLVGIVNGVDYGDWSPETDPHLWASYSADDLAGKRVNKEELLKSSEMEVLRSEDGGRELPLLGIVSRFTAQKGFELLSEMLPVLLREGQVQLAVLGSGEEQYERYFHWLRETFPDHVAFFAGYNEPLAHQIEAGADIFLMPSRYEPCGLNQMYSMRYGTAPVVRRTGGLADTVTPFDPERGTGTGFLFDEFSSSALFDAVRHALDCYAEPESWERLMKNGMAQDWSWERQGAEYVALYDHLKRS